MDAVVDAGNWRDVEGVGRQDRVIDQVNPERGRLSEVHGNAGRRGKEWRERR